MNNPENKFIPSHECIFCKKTIDEVGGRKIVSKYDLSISYSTKYLGGGNKDYPYLSIKLDDNHYLNFRGNKELWTKELEEYVIKEFVENRHPWYCQQCAGKVCKLCGSPVQYQHGCDILYDDGRITHFGIFPFPAGCINPECKNHR